MQNSPSPQPDEKSLLELLELGRDDDPNWNWPDTSRRKWEVVTGRYHCFSNHWRDPSTGSDCYKRFPYELELGVDLDGAPLLPFHGDDTTGNRILVTKAYEEMFYRILRLRKMDKGTRRGVVITGQPGIGKTTFQKLMLAYLIKGHQVVLLCDSEDIHLFYRGQVYWRPTTSGFGDLPRHKRALYCPIWALIDVDYQDRGPPIGSSSNVWPIQTSSPNPVRWKRWRRQAGGALLGLPLWNVEELIEGLRLHPKYNKLRSRLQQSPFLDGLAPLTTDDETIDSVLNVLREEKRVATAETYHEMDDGTRLSAIAQGVDVVDEAGHIEVDGALRSLVRNATEEFGFAPRDVYAGIFDLPGTRSRHAAEVMTVNHSKLMALVDAFSQRGELSELSHHVVALHPYKLLLDYDLWAIDFKSIQIAREVVKLMQSELDEHLQETYDYLHNVPEGPALAEWTFKAIIHRMISDGWRSGGPAPQPIRMVSNNRSHPTSPISPYRSSLSSSTTDTSLSPPAPLRAGTRTVTRTDFTHGLSNVTLDNDKYYILTAATDPPLESFTIDLNPDHRTAIISVFRIAISPRNDTHEGSTEGYPLIPKVVAHVRELLKHSGSDAKVKVAYFLVCPEDGSRHRWEMPADWNEAETHDNYGGAFCIRLHISSPRYTRVNLP